MKKITYAILRFVYTTWQIVWKFILAFTLAAILLLGSALALLQIDKVKNIASNFVENRFNQKFNGHLTVGKVDGFIPFYISAEDISLTYSDASSVNHDSTSLANLQSPASARDTLISIDSLAIGIDWTGLYRKKISINYLIVENPAVRLLHSLTDTTYTLAKALARKQPAAEVNQPQETPILSMETIQSLEILAPRVDIKNGFFMMETANNVNKNVILPDTLVARNFNLSTFLEVREEQRYLDISNFYVDLPNLFIEKLTASGQIFNDDRFLEFNGFMLETDLSQFNLSGEIDGFNAFRANWSEQFQKARYNVISDSTIIYTSEFADILPKLPVYNKPFHLSTELEGDRKSLEVVNMELGFNKSLIKANGRIDSLQSPEEISYDIDLYESDIYTSDFYLLRNRIQPQSPAFSLNHFKAEGSVAGEQKTLGGNLTITSKQDTLQTTFSTQFEDSVIYQMQLVGKNINLGVYTGLSETNTNVNFGISLNGVGLEPKSARLTLEGSLDDSRIQGRPIEQLFVFGGLRNGFLETELKLFNQDEIIKANSWADILSSDPIINIEGTGQNMDISRYFKYPKVPTTSINATFNSSIQGLSVDEVYGTAKLTMKPHNVGGDSLANQVFKASLNTPASEERIFTFSSPFGILEATGKIIPSQAISLVKQWTNYTKRRFQNEILLTDSLTHNFSNFRPVQTNDMTVSVALKDLTLLKSYLPAMPDIITNGNLKASLQANRQNLGLSVETGADSLWINKVKINGLALKTTAELHYQSTLKEQSRLNSTLAIDSLLVEPLGFKNIDFGLSLKNDSLWMENHFNGIDTNAEFDLSLASLLDTTSITTTIEQFFAGNTTYAWQENNSPQVVYKPNSIEINGFRLQSEQEFISVDGTFSNLPQDSIIYNLANVHLERISRLIQPKFSFGGILNGSFYTQSLSKQPVVSGSINVTQFAMENRMIGDVAFNSQYNQTNKRFDTHLEVVTVPSKYQNYLSKNDGIGQKIYVDGYFYPPKEGVEQDTVYNFDVNMPEIDLWILPFIVQNVFEKVEGVAQGNGTITGNMDSFYFDSDFQIDSVQVNTVFLNTNYQLKGNLSVNSEEGATLDSLKVRDNRNGTGILYGTFDFNDFSEEKLFDLWLQLDNLAFLNTNFSRDVPFYGKAKGSGLVHLTGSNISPLLSSVNPIVVSQNAKIGIPLLEEITVQENTRSIQFVNDFDDIRKKVRDNTVKVIKLDPTETEESREFTEFFDLNLQFVAPENITGEMIFDPVANENITAQGTGILQVILQDGDLSMFGSFEIASGQYNFVSGDVFTRRFKLQQGGTIRWEGDPENARLDINAIYRARPDVSSIFGINQTDNDPADIQRIPVELILHITGTVETVENDFTFRVPNTLEASQSPRINDLETRLNRDNNKLLQATSLLLTGELVPVTLTTNQDATSALGSNFRNEGGNVVLSPLLSSQISNLLNNNISNLDFDLNMAGFDQVDLGIALRLFNDKLILSREGQIGGSQNDIGTIEATYKLNGAFAVKAFHRQDPTFGTLNSNDAGQSIQSLNGVGLEAQFQFNNWNRFTSVFADSFKEVFGINKKDDKKSEDSSTDTKKASPTAAKDGTLKKNEEKEKN